MLEYLNVGQIVNTHGVRGEIKVLPLTDDPNRFNSLKKAYIDKNGQLEAVKIKGAKFQKNTVILKIEGIDDMNSAEKLKGFYLKVDRQNAVKLPEDTYFIADLIGCRVFEKDVLLGEITDVIQTGSNDVYVIKSDEGKELLLPALKSVILDISISERRIQVLVPEGLTD